MVTRLRNPDSKLSQLKNQQVAAAIHEANKGFKEGREVRDGTWEGKGEEGRGHCGGDGGFHAGFDHLPL